LGLAWDYRRYLFVKHFQLLHNAETLNPNDDEVSYIVDAELTLRYRLNSWASLSFRTEWDYTDSSDDKSLEDWRCKVGLGVNWCRWADLQLTCPTTYKMLEPFLECFLPLLCILLLALPRIELASLILPRRAIGVGWTLLWVVITGT